MLVVLCFACVEKVGVLQDVGTIIVCISTRCLSSVT